MKMERTPTQGGPSSALGIMRFFDTDSNKPKITPELVIGVTIFFTALMLVFHFLGIK